MYFLEQRVERICKELKELVTVRKRPLLEIQYKKGLFFYPDEAEKSKQSWQSFVPGKSRWHGPDQHYWFRAAYSIPTEFREKTLCLMVKTQVEGWDDAKNPQFLLFVNDQVTQGLDLNHQIVKLTKCAVPGEVWKIDLQAYTGIIYAEFDLMLEIHQIDEQINGFFFDLSVPLKALNRMEKESKARIDLVEHLNGAVNLLDLRDPYSDAFYHSLNQAKQYLQTHVYGKRPGFEDVMMTCIGHTHIDVAWWWTVSQTKEKTARSFATVLKLMEEYPDYQFMSSQPLLYAFVKDRYPQMYQKIKERVAEGRWFPEGGMWVEADTNLPSGESLVRQFLYGKRFFKEEFGVESRVLWLPDVFGYTGALPQIMKLCGIDYFMTTKLAWNQINKIPHDTFRWRGIDGTEILTHLITTVEVGQNPKETFYTTYNGILHPDALMGSWERYQDKGINTDILVCYGYGDGGGGPTREMEETYIRMKQGVQGIPGVRHANPLHYFMELDERVRDNRRLAVWEGELYFEYHRGTYTSMARNKRSNRKCETMMMDLEFLAVLCGDTDRIKLEMDRMWNTILMNQFHDIIPGSSIKEVYDVTAEEYAEIGMQGNGMIRERIAVLAGSEGEGITIFNTTGFMRSDIVRIPGVLRGVLVDQQGRSYPIQPMMSDSLVYLTNLPAKGFRTYMFREEEISESPFRIAERSLKTPYYDVIFDEYGRMVSLYDREHHREIIQTGKTANSFRVYEDKPMDYDNWDIDMYYTEKSWDVMEFTHFKWIAEGPVCACLMLERPFGKSRIVQKIHFYANTPRIDFETYVDWKEHQCLLKVHFPVEIHTDEAVFDIQFGNLSRKVHRNTSWDEARFEVCGQKWMDLSEGHYGVSLLNDCKYGHSVKDSDMALTLIKSGILPNKTADQEEHVFTYALYPHSGDIRNCTTVQESYCLNFPCYVHMGGQPNREASFVQSNQKNVMIETIKQAEDSKEIVIRLYEYENSRTEVTLTFGQGLNLGMEQVWECNLMEEVLEDVLLNSNTSFSFTIKPFEIKTYKIAVKSN